MTNRGFVTFEAVKELAKEIGTVTGKLGREIEQLSSLYVEMGARIARLEKRVAELTDTKRRSRTGRRRDVAAAAE